MGKSPVFFNDSTTFFESAFVVSSLYNSSDVLSTIFPLFSPKLAFFSKNRLNSSDYYKKVGGLYNPPTFFILESLVSTLKAPTIPL
ncbi:hypothetical protein E4U01_06905 [Streptococcus acidominimus]|uniref:Uncharacterized protein n=1 Tax=Streptococcus acidominimus TaxID=1326 RepID=A0A4Y9FM00_STRAI|nr:hypothetical protein [Streptococcus acidominimus]TFU30247.1 hypothetical protein E4U01_06905 [Streptococcus acidominimus]